MKNTLTTTEDSIGWYECRFIRNPVDYRVARWWDGSRLFATPHYSNTHCDVREYTEFVQLSYKATMKNEYLARLAIPYTALLGILVEKGVFTMKEFEVALAKAAIAIDEEMSAENVGQRARPASAAQIDDSM